MSEHLPPDLDAAMLDVLRQRMAARGMSGNALSAAIVMPQPTLARKLSAAGTFTLAQWDVVAVALATHLEDMLEEARQLLRQTGD